MHHGGCLRQQIRVLLSEANVGTSALGCPGKRSSLEVSFVHPCTQARGDSSPRGPRGCPCAILTMTTRLMSRNHELGTINGCRNLPAPRPAIPHSTRAPVSITIFRKLKHGRTSFQDMRLLWMILNSPPFAQRRACRTSVPGVEIVKGISAGISQPRHFPGECRESSA
jgi:hypothetical protein